MLLVFARLYIKQILSKLISPPALPVANVTSISLPAPRGDGPHGLRRVATTLTAILALVALYVAPANAAGSTPVIVTEAQILRSGSEAPPTSGWQPFRLPLTQSGEFLDDMDEGEVVWFRIEIPREIRLADRRTQSLYIWRHNIRLEVYLDGEYLGGTDRGRFGWPSSAWNHPVLLDLPGDLSSVEAIYVRVVGGPSGPILSPVMMGAREDLAVFHDSRYFWQVEASQWAFTICLILGVFATWLWYRRRQDTIYLQFAGMSFLWCVSNAFGFLTFIPFDLRLWLIAVHSAFDWGTYLMIAFTLRAIEVRAEWLTRSLFWVAVVSTVLHIVVPDRYFFPTAFPFHAIETLCVIGTALMITWHTISRREATSAWFSIAFLGAIALMSHDFYVVFIGSDEAHVDASNWMHLSLPLFAIAFYAHLITRFVGALDATEDLNRELAGRVEETRAALEASYAEKRGMELQQAATEERAKIYRDLHDDVGSRLVSIVHGDAGGKASELASHALESLRQAIYRANFDDESIGSFIAGAVDEMQLRIESAGLSFIHSVDGGGETQLTADEAYNLTRIFREVVSNTLHHARATGLTVAINVDGDHLRWQVTDDGIGWNSEVAANGGLANIKYRARQIGARVHWEDRSPGTRFVLELDMGKLGTLDRATSTIR